jgi:hypothetical protein
MLTSRRKQKKKCRLARMQLRGQHTEEKSLPTELHTMSSRPMVTETMAGGVSSAHRDHWVV